MRKGSNLGEGFKIGGGLIAALIAVIVLTVGGGIFAAHYDNWFSEQTAEPRGQRDMRENTQANGAFRQAVYEDFFALCTSAKTAQDQINTLKEEKETATEDRKANLDVSISALNMSLSSAVNEYNSKANQFHKAAFLDAKLPYPLNAKADIQCV